MPSGFKRNPSLATQLRKDPAFRAEQRKLAERVKDMAERESPIGKTGDYIHGFIITETAAAVRVGNTDFAAHLVEWGSVNNPAYAPLRRGVRAAGLRLDEQ